jgi:hypothetical protein
MRGLELIGKKVIVRSNENEPYFVGEFAGFTNFSRSNSLIPVVKDENGKEWGAMGVIVPYSVQMAEVLDKMTPSQQWEWLKDISICIQITHIK